MSEKNPIPAPPIACACSQPPRHRPGSGAIKDVQVGGQNSSLHIPAHLPGPTCACGSGGIAALNAIQGAEMKVSGKPAADGQAQSQKPAYVAGLHAAENCGQDNLNCRRASVGREWD